MIAFDVVPMGEFPKGNLVGHCKNQNVKLWVGNNSYFFVFKNVFSITIYKTARKFSECVTEEFVDLFLIQFRAKTNTYLDCFVYIISQHYM